MSARDRWKSELARTESCVEVERFDAMTEADRRHIATCARCEAELALWIEFDSGETRSEERPVVESIARGLAVRSGKVIEMDSSSSRQPQSGRLRLMALAATLALLVGVGYLIENRQPSVAVTVGRDDLYRSTRIEVLAPAGDVDAAPHALAWKAVPGATSYDVQVHEVDGALLWRASASGPSIELPPAVFAQCVPGKPILWKVVALRNGTGFAESGTQRFRVGIK